MLYYYYSSLATAENYSCLENDGLVRILTILQIEVIVCYYQLDRRPYLFIYKTNVVILGPFAISPGALSSRHAHASRSNDERWDSSNPP